MPIKHIHRYERAKLGRNGYVIYKCNLPACTHYLGKQFVRGKLGRCNVCDSTMIMDSFALTLAKPHCHDCTVKRDKSDLDRLAELMGEGA